MKDINRVVIGGRLTRDPELRTTANGTDVLLLGVASNDRAKVQGEWTDKANFVDCKLFGARAAKLAKMLKKGDKVLIDGRLSYSSWKDSEGRNRSKLEVLADEIDTPKPSKETPQYDDDIPL